MKAETERSALDVKLKHARNQVDVEIKRRQRAEADCEKLVCIVCCARIMPAGQAEASSDNVRTCQIYPVSSTLKNKKQPVHCL